MGESRNPAVKSELAIAAEKALEKAKKLPGGPERSEALKEAGKFRNEACLEDLCQAFEFGWVL